MRIGGSINLVISTLIAPPCQGPQFTFCSPFLVFDNNCSQDTRLEKKSRAGLMFKMVLSESRKISKAVNVPSRISMLEGNMDWPLMPRLMKKGEGFFIADKEFSGSCTLPTGDQC